MLFTLSVLLAAINIYSPKAGNRVQILFFLVKVAALLAIIVGGIYRMALG